MLGRMIRDWMRARLGAGPGATPAGHTAADVLQGLLRVESRPPAAFDYEQVAYLLAAAGSARYMTERMAGARNLVQRAELLDFALAQCSLHGLVLEFGVYKGDSLQMISDRCAGSVHGFDTFEGLPEDWTHFQKKGRFSLEGRAPDVGRANVVLHKGLFSDTLPEFLAAHSGPVRFAHIDSDLYSSAKAVLDLVEPRLVPGTVIVFDEYLNYPGWEQHEYRAFQEMVARAGRRYEYLGFASAYGSVALRITG
ncbi:MAG TPA: class I SAM-dependent methyltransferase [Burkholderiales bacterium]|nr:class I SAM-dependent methyltransferase [Burkholderiales bacterium]